MLSAVLFTTWVIYTAKENMYITYSIDVQDLEQKLTSGPLLCSYFSSLSVSELQLIGDRLNVLSGQTRRFDS